MSLYFISVGLSLITINLIPPILLILCQNTDNI
nr:MAG TPA: hypothetical protein [Herelleviridae sp.]